MKIARPWLTISFSIFFFESKILNSKFQNFNAIFPLKFLIHFNWTVFFDWQPHSLITNSNVTKKISFISMHCIRSMCVVKILLVHYHPFNIAIQMKNFQEGWIELSEWEGERVRGKWKSTLQNNPSLLILTPRRPLSTHSLWHITQKKGGKEENLWKTHTHTHLHM